MKLAYDPAVDALYIRLIEAPRQVTTQRLTDDVAVDYGPDGEVVGIEVLDATANAFLGSDHNILIENLKAVTER
jgi:uncharacterized protein YuzE